MGFSLEYFFKHLEDIINDPHLSLEIKYDRLLKTIKAGKEYAEVYGKL